MSETQTHAINKQLKHQRQSAPDRAATSKALSVKVSSTCYIELSNTDARENISETQTHRDTEKELRTRPAAEDLRHDQNSSRPDRTEQLLLTLSLSLCVCVSLSLSLTLSLSLIHSLTLSLTLSHRHTHGRFKDTPPSAAYHLCARARVCVISPQSIVYLIHCSKVLSNINVSERVSSDHQGCIYLIKYTVKSEILF